MTIFQKSEVKILKSSKYRKDIQVLRGIAVLAVVLFHAKESYFPLGYLGVDVFFIISGFVVTPLILRIYSEEQSNVKRLVNLKNFYKRRFFRLAPALAATLIISAITITFLGGPLDHQRFARQGVATLLMLGNFGAYRYSGNYFAPNPNPLVHNWSLSLEEQIYIFLPLILTIVLYKFKKIPKPTFIFFLAITSLSFVSFLNPGLWDPIFSRIGIGAGSQFSFYSPIDRTWQFTLGGLGYFLIDGRDFKQIKFLKIFNISLIFGIFLLLFGDIDLSLSGRSVAASMITVLVLTARSLEELPKFFLDRLEWFGDRSYSIYLVHMPLIYLAKFSPATIIGEGANRTIQTAIAVVLSIFLGSLSHSAIENRFRDLGKITSLGLSKITISLMLSFALPLSLFVTLDAATRQNYWGLNRNIPTPEYAGALDPNCARDSVAGPLCDYSTSSASKTVLLIGDSHAGHISQAVIEAAQSYGINPIVWTHSGCPITFDQSTSPNILESCISVNKKMLNWVRIHKPDYLIVSQFVRADYKVETLKSALFELKSIVRETILIENNPVFPDEEKFMIDNSLLMKPYNAPKFFPVRLMDYSDKEASDVLVNWARGKGIATLSFNSLFCNSQYCQRFSNSNWLYRDTDHFSVAGAALTVPRIIAYLKSAQSSNS